MRQLNNKQFDTKEGASASLSEIVSSQLAPSVSQKDEIMKTYDVIKVENGYQVIWFWSNTYTKTGFQSLENFVDNGFFKDKNDAICRANELQYFGEEGK